MDLEASTQILKNILISELEQASPRNRLWTRKLVCVSYAEAQFSLKLASSIGYVLASRPIILQIPRESVALFTETQLRKRGVERLNYQKKRGKFLYYATQEAPKEILFRKKKACYTATNENAAQIIDLRLQWFEFLPYDARVIKGKLVLRAAEYLERLRETAEHDIMRIGNEAVWKKASKKARRSLDFCSIAAFDRVLVVNLLRKNFLKLTPKCEYLYHFHDSEIKASTPHKLHFLLFAVSKRNRYRYFPLKAS